MKDIFKKNRKKILYGLISLVVVIFILVVVKKNNTPTFNDHVVSLSDVTEQVSIAGSVESENFAELGFNVTGRIAKVSASLGDTVKKGQVLVALDTQELQADLADAQAQVSISRGNSENDQLNVNDVRSAQDEIVESARRKLLSSNLEAVAQSSNLFLESPEFSGTYMGEEGQYKFRILKSEVNVNDYYVRIFGLEEGEYDLEENRPMPFGSKGLFLFVGDNINEYTDTTWYLDIPNKKGSSYTVNLNAYNEAVKNRNVALTEAERSLRSTNTLSSVAEAQLQQAQARVSRINAQIEQRLIRAPFDGTVSFLNAEVGEIITAGTVTASLVGQSQFEIKVNVPEIDVAKLTIGDSLSIQLDAYPEDVSWSGTIVAISPAETYVDGVPVYETRVSFNDPDERVRAGMTATVNIETETVQDVLAVPLEYLERDQDGYFVNVVTYDEKGRRKVKRKDVVVGLVGTNGLVQIRNGVDKGDILEKITSQL